LGLNVLIGLDSLATLPHEYTNGIPGSHILARKRREKCDFTKIYIRRGRKRACAGGRFLRPQLSYHI